MEDNKYDLPDVSNDLIDKKDELLFEKKELESKKEDIFEKKGLDSKKEDIFEKKPLGKELDINSKNNIYDVKAIEQSDMKNSQINYLNYNKHSNNN